MIAQDLYRLQREVEALEKELEMIPAVDRDELRERLRKTKAERDRVRRILEGCKEPPPCRQPL